MLEGKLNTAIPFFSPHKLPGQSPEQVRAPQHARSKKTHPWHGPGSLLLEAKPGVVKG